MSEIDLVVSAGLDGLRVDRALALLTGLARSSVAAALAEGRVRLDGRVLIKASTALGEGQRLEASVPEPEAAVGAEPEVEVVVVLEDPSFVVVDKPAGLVVHPGAGRRRGTLVAGLLARYPEIGRLVDVGADPDRPGIVHRLDKGTSGLLVVARTEPAWRSLAAQLSERRVTREYVGLVEGHLSEERGTIEAPLGRSATRPTAMAVRVDGRPARTHYEVISRESSPARTLLRLHLDTGRTHQIRVHLASIGHPVVNDLRYGHRREPALDPERPFLHARRLSFDHPLDATRVEVVSALPADLVAVVGAAAERI